MNLCFLKGKAIFRSKYQGSTNGLPNLGRAFKKLIYRVMIAAESLLKKIVVYLNQTLGSWKSGNTSCSSHKVVFQLQASYLSALEPWSSRSRNKNGNGSRCIRRATAGSNAEYGKNVCTNIIRLFPGKQTDTTKIVLLIPPPQKNDDTIQ